MAGKAIVVDTCILIDFFRKTDMSKLVLMSLVKENYTFCLSVISEYEIYSGASADQRAYWEEFLEKTEVLPFDSKAVKVALSINAHLKLKRKQIELADLFIAATAVAQKLPFAALNKKHFERIDDLVIIG